MREARFTHNCDSCIDLGQFDSAEWSYDLYWCPQAGSPTVLARYSDDGPDYLSGMAFGVMHKDDPKNPLGEAYRRAKDRMKPVRYAIRPKPNTIKGWYVWAVVWSDELNRIEAWASEPYSLYSTKREAERVCKQLNAQLVKQERTNGR